jgi:nucleotide-binding universal stress UspA family protein
MNRVTHVLAASDLSPESAHVVQRATRIASVSGARCTVLHSLGLDVPNVVRSFFGQDTAAITKGVIDGVRANLVETTTRLGPETPGTSVVVETGLPGPTIKDFAAQHDVDLIVVGGFSGHLVRRMVLGSTASQVVRRSTCPVLVVRLPAVRDYRRVLIAVDFSPASATSIQLAQELAPEAELVLIHVAALPLQAQMRYAGVSEEQIEQYRTEARSRATWSLEQVVRAAGLEPGGHAAIVVDGDPVEQIRTHSEDADCDLVVVGKHGAHRIEEVLLGSVTLGLLSSCSRDVLVVGDPTGPPTG